MKVFAAWTPKPRQGLSRSHDQLLIRLGLKKEDASPGDAFRIPRRRVKRCRSGFLFFASAKKEEAVSYLGLVEIGIPTIGDMVEGIPEE